MKKSKGSPSKSDDKEGHFLVTVAAALLGLGLAVGVAFLANGIIRDRYSSMSDDWISTQVFGVVAFVGALIAVAGLIVRATAHNRADLKNLDYFGKQLAASTAGFVLVAAEVKLDPSIFYTVGGLTIAISLIVLAICVPALKR